MVHCCKVLSSTFTTVPTGGAVALPLQRYHRIVPKQAGAILIKEGGKEPRRRRWRWLNGKWNLCILLLGQWKIPSDCCFKESLLIQTFDLYSRHSKTSPCCPGTFQWNSMNKFVQSKNRCESFSKFTSKRALLKGFPYICQELFCFFCHKSEWAAAVFIANLIH